MLIYAEKPMKRMRIYNLVQKHYENFNLGGKV